MVNVEQPIRAGTAALPTESYSGAWSNKLGIACLYNLQLNSADGQLSKPSDIHAVPTVFIQSYFV